MQDSASNIGPPAVAPRPLTPRAQALLNCVQTQLEKLLAIPLQECMLTLGEQISTHSSRSHSIDRQDTFAGQALSATKQAPAFSSAFLRASRQSLESLSEPLQSDRSDDPLRFDQLSLVDDVTIDTDIILRDFTRRESARNSDALHCLAQRFAVIAECPIWEPDALPLSPAWIGRRLTQATRDLALEPAVVLRLFQVFAARMTPYLGDFFKQVNALLDEAGILPGLEANALTARVPGLRRRPQAVTEATPFSLEELPPSSISPPGFPQGKPPLQPAAGIGAAVPWLQVLQETFSNDRGLVHTPEHAIAVLKHVVAAALGLAPPAPLRPGTASDCNEVSREDVSSILARLQALTANNAHAGHRSVEDIRTALLAQARAENGGKANLSPHDENSIGLISMLYRHLRRFMHPHSSASDLLAQLQLPLLRSALQDPNFFVRGEHPIRELLNTVAEAGACWQTDEDVDPQWVVKLSQAVQQVADAFDGDEQIFATVNQSLQDQRAAVTRRAELAERRFIEAARGRERMSVARKQAEAAIEQACATQPGPPPIVARLLRQAWTDVLMLTLLRQGADSEQWGHMLITTAQIVATTSKHPAYMRDKALESEVEAALMQVGCLSDEARIFARCLATPGGSPAILQEELEQRLSARTRLGAAKDADNTCSTNASDSILDQDADHCLQHILALPHGSWFEFAGPPPVEWRRLRLSWFSQISGNTIFVNSRGQKVFEPSLAQLARDMAAQQVRLVPNNQPRLIDQAWQATLHELRQQVDTRVTEATP